MDSFSWLFAKNQKKISCVTKCSRVVSDHSTTFASHLLTSEIERVQVDRCNMNATENQVNF